MAKLTEEEKIFNTVKRLLEINPEAVVRAVVEVPFWAPGLKANEQYTRLHDDHDGTHEGSITVTISPDGDAWVGVDSRQFLRYRMWQGGGQSIRTRNALMLLASAINLDNIKGRL